MAVQQPMTYIIGLHRDVIDLEDKLTSNGSFKTPVVTSSRTGYDDLFGTLLGNFER